MDPAATSAVKRAEASLKEARLIYNNTTALFKQGVVSNVDYQRAGVALDAAVARRQAAVESVYQAQAELVERRAALALARQRRDYQAAGDARRVSRGERSGGPAGAPESDAPATADSRAPVAQSASRP